MTPDPDRPADPARPAATEAARGASAPTDPGVPTVPAVPAAWAPDDPSFEAAVLRAFVKDGRLASIPARERKKLVVWRYLTDQVFPDPAEELHERDVNMRLALWHPDVATIRRALSDLGFVSRTGMTYRRAVPRRTRDEPTR